VFQALRIAVNDELNNLRKFLPQAFEALGPVALECSYFHSVRTASSRMNFVTVYNLIKQNIFFKF